MVGAHTHPRASEFLIASNQTIRTGYVMETGANTFIDLTLNVSPDPAHTQKQSLRIPILTFHPAS
jgi:hypothetical protein